MHSIMVAGSAAGYTDAQVALARRIGAEIAEAGCALVNGATTGLPLVSADSARSAGGKIIAVSPAATLDEHLGLFRFPKYEPDELVFVGALASETWVQHVAPHITSGVADLVRELERQFRLKFRNIISVAMADAVIAIGGRIGTVNELTIASDMAKLIGIVKGGGGNAEEFPGMVERSGKQKAPVLVGSPEDLVHQILQVLQA